MYIIYRNVDAWERIAREVVESLVRGSSVHEVHRMRRSLSAEVSGAWIYDRLCFWSTFHAWEFRSLRGWWRHPPRRSPVRIQRSFYRCPTASPDFSRQEEVHSLFQVWRNDFFYGRNRLSCVSKPKAEARTKNQRFLSWFLGFVGPEVFVRCRSRSPVISRTTSFSWKEMRYFDAFSNLILYKILHVLANRLFGRDCARIIDAFWLRDGSWIQAAHWYGNVRCLCRKGQTCNEIIKSMRME